MTEKGKMFWTGLVIFGLSISSLFASLWYPLIIYNQYSYNYYGSYDYSPLKYFAPWAFGSLVFMIIGFYMMWNETKKAKHELALP
jgi:hypothetical protein